MIMATDNKDKVLNVPNLRFPEFCEEWMRCTLGDITENFSRRNKEEILYPMFSVTNNKGFIPQSEQFEDREMIGEDIKAYKIIHKDDFAYNPARINVGSIAKYNEENPCMISSLYVCFKTNPKIDNDWMMQLLKTPKMNFYYNINGEGGVRIYLFYPNFARIKTSYPTLKEQQKISSFLTLLDERISTQNKIIEDLKKLKVAIRDKAIALGIKKSAFNTLDSIADIYQPQTIPTSLLSEDAEYFVYGANGIIGKYTEYNHSEPQICIACRGNTCGTINFSTAKSWITGNAMVVNTDQYSVINKRYLYHYLSTINFNPLISGSGQPQIVRQPLAKLKIPTPSIEQQVGIVKVIDSFELKIEIEKKYLQSLLTQKVYLLSNMFI